MLSRTINEYEVVLQMSSTSPFLVKEGRFRLLREDCGNPKNLPNDIPISRNSEGAIRQAMTLAGNGQIQKATGELAGFQFFIPGASLRGAWRSWLERTLRSMEAPGHPKICNPFAQAAGDPERSCSKSLEKGANPYARSCPVCRLFGSTVQAGRLDIGDAEIISGCVPTVQVRDQVAINRVKGGVENLYQIYVLENATFEVKIRLRNFELVQIHLLGMIFSAVDRIAIGSGKGKGFGMFSHTYVSAKLRYFGTRPNDNRLRGIGEDPVWGEELRARYRIQERTSPELPAVDGEMWPEEGGNPYRFARSVEETAFAQLWQGVDLGFDKIPTLSTNRGQR